VAFLFLGGGVALADESQLAIPDLHKGTFTIGGKVITAWNLLFYAPLVITGTLGIASTSATRSASCRPTRPC
jgi:K(+)-stimulated pyrophosphate-energized sodium pump